MILFIDVNAGFKMSKWLLSITMCTIVRFVKEVCCPKYKNN